MLQSSQAAPCWRFFESFSMSIDRRKVLLFGAAIAVRVALSTVFPSLPDLLTGRVEISTPVTSFKRCEPRGSDGLQLFLEAYADNLWPFTVQEGLFLYTHHLSPYDGGVYHQVSFLRPASDEQPPDQLLTQAPLLLSLFALFPNINKYPFPTNALYIVLDILCANALMSIADSGVSVSSYSFTSSRKSVRWSSIGIGSA